ncbi:hypothetical protein Peur_042662 [Populus x canadensis]
MQRTGEIASRGYWQLYPLKAGGKGTSEENGKRGKNTRPTVRIQVKSKSYLHSGDTKHVMSGMAIITLVFGVPWFLMNKAAESVRSHVLEAWHGVWQRKLCLFV